MNQLPADFEFELIFKLNPTFYAKFSKTFETLSSLGMQINKKKLAVWKKYFIDSHIIAFIFGATCNDIIFFI